MTEAPITQTLNNARPVEFFGRVLIAGSISALLFVFLAAHSDYVANWYGRELRILPRFGVFAGVALFALLTQGGRPSRRSLFLLASICAVSCYLLLPVLHVDLRSSGASLQPILQLMAYQLGILGAVCFGTWLGRDVRNSYHFVTLVMCAAAGDVWLSVFHVPESVDAQHPLRLLRLVWPLPAGDISASPALSDLIFVSAFMEGARQVKIPQYAVVTGALAGYCAGSFLSLEPLPGLPALSMVMCGSGILIGCWPDLKCGAREMGRAFLISAVLLSLLLGLSALHARLHPVPEPPPNQTYYRGVV